MRKQQFHTIIALGILAAITLLSFLQIYVQRNYIHRFLAGTYRSHTLSGMDRSELFLLDRSGANFLDFIRVNTPDNGPVIVPKDTPSMLREQSVMQFFLMPRGIPSCSCSRNPAEYSESCVNCLRIPGHTIPAVGNFPDPEVMEGYKQFLPFPGNNPLYKGIYIALDAEPVTTIPEKAGILPEMILAVIMDLSAVVALCLTGSLIIRSFHPNLGLPDTWLSAFPLGAGLHTWISFLSGWAGLKINLVLYVGSWLLLTIPAFLITRKRGDLPFPDKISLPDREAFTRTIRKNPIFLSLLLITSGIIFSMFIISIGRGYSLFDGIANWALKGYAIALEKSVFAGSKWGGHGLAYPQNIHHMIALFRLLDNDILPGSKLLYPLFASSMGFTVYRFWRRNETPRLIAAAGLLFLLTIPELYRFSTYGWSNIIFTGYIVTGSIHISDWIKNRESPDLLLGSILLGLAGWSRPEGIGFAAAIAGANTLLFLLIHKKPKTQLLNILPAILIPGIWIVFGYRYMSGDEVGGVLKDVVLATAGGEFDFTALRILMQYAYEHFSNPKLWGGVMPLLMYAGPVLLLAGGHKTRTAAIIPTLISGVIAFLIPHLMFFLAYFNKTNLYMLFLDVSYDRALFPGVVLLFTTFVLLIPKINPGIQIEAPEHNSELSH